MNIMNKDMDGYLLFGWNDETAWKLFDLDQMKPYLDTIHLDHSKLFPIGKRKISLRDRFFGYSINDMDFSTHDE